MKIILIIVLISALGCTQEPAERIAPAPVPVVESAKVYTVTATVYHAVPEQCNNDPEHTASMFKLDLSNPWKHRVIAVSRELRKDFPYGTRVLVSGTGKYNGIYRVEDTMNKRFRKRIDILINKGMPLGKWHNVKLQKID